MSLEYQHVLGETPPLKPAEVLFYLLPEDIYCAMHGLRLLYNEQRRIYGPPEPEIKVAPVVFLHSRYGGWFRVEASREYKLLFHHNNELSRHLNEVRQAAKELLSDINQKLGCTLQIRTLLEHYNDDDGFAALSGVDDRGNNEFLVITGDKTHYLMPEPSVPNCQYHDWFNCNNVGVSSNPGPIVESSTSPPSLFVSRELRHCAHRDVYVAKRCEITLENRSRCGPRSGQEGQAFCEIWRFEQYLCCRACAFEEVCTRAPVFRLPCNW